MKLLDKLKTKINVEEKSLAVKEIKVPDLKQYLVDGYNEITDVKRKLEQVEEQLEQERLNKIKYEASLVILNEFKQRDVNNNEKINELKNKLEEKDREIYNLNSSLNTYKINERELKIKVKDEIINDLENKINNHKGHIPKEKIIEFLGRTKYEI